MSNNIRNKTIFETKIAKIVRLAILQCIVTELCIGQNSNFKSGFLAKTSNFLEKM